METPANNAHKLPCLYTDGDREEGNDKKVAEDRRGHRFECAWVGRSKLRELRVDEVLESRGPPIEDERWTDAEDDEQHEAIEEDVVGMHIGCVR